MAEPLTQETPCVVCAAVDRWDDAGVWRCRPCWPTPLTVRAQQAERREQAKTRAQGKPVFQHRKRPAQRHPMKQGA